jgi:steroid delta-isomerase-like uncharacterized protein
VKTTLGLALFVCATMNAVFAATTNTGQPLTSRQEINKAVARRVFEEIFNQGRFEIADEIYARDFVNHGLHRNFDLAEDQAAARWEKQIAPDLNMTVDLMVADEDFATVVWTARGTNTARIGWLPATGVRFEERGITVWRMVDGKIHEEWTSFDLFQIVEQIATQLKWRLIACLLLLIILVWMIVRLFGRKSARNAAA